MDLLSLALARMRLSSSLLARFDAAAPWSVDIVDGRAMTAYYVLTGNCWFIPVDDQPPIQMYEGDLLMLPDWRDHQLCSSPNVASIPLSQVAEREGKELWNPDRPLSDVMVLDHRTDPSKSPDMQLLAMMFRAEDNLQGYAGNCLLP